MGDCVTLHGLGTDQHPVLGPVKYSIRELGSDPDSQVLQTIQVMRERVAQDCIDPQFQSRAQLLIDPQSSMSQGWIAHQVWNHVKGAIQFQRDERVGVRGDGLGIGGGNPEDIVEVLIRLRDMARYIDSGVAIGDCDDFSMYLACLLKSLGVDCSFCTVAASSQAPNQFSHVYVVAYPNGERVPCDASHGEWCGWEYENPYGKREEWPVYSQGRLALNSLATGAVVVAGLWMGYQYLRRDWI